MLTEKQLMEAVGYHCSLENCRAVERAVIAAYEVKLREQEPVAWITSDGLVKLLTTIACWTLVQKSEDAGFDTPLYTNPAPIPEGYALVPLKPNEAMLHHMMGCITHSADTRRNHYKMLLAAARSGE